MGDLGPAHPQPQRLDRLVDADDRQPVVLSADDSASTRHLAEAGRELRVVGRHQVEGPGAAAEDVPDLDPVHRMPPGALEPFPLSKRQEQYAALAFALNSVRVERADGQDRLKGACEHSAERVQPSVSRE